MICCKDLKEFGDWKTFSFAKQMSIVGGEVEKIIKLRDLGAIEESREILFVVVDLLNLSANDPKVRACGNLKEVLYVRDALVDYYMYDNFYETTDQEFEKYFSEFIRLAAAEKTRLTFKIKQEVMDKIVIRR